MGELFSIEGISGTGKTTIINRLQKEYQQDKFVFIKEIFNEEHLGLKEKIFDALYFTKDRFFDMGIPLTETMLLLARLMYQYECVINKSEYKDKIIVEDRGLDTVLVAQAIMINKTYGYEIDTVIEQLFSFVEGFIQIPDKTFLLYGNTDLTIERAQARDNKPYTEEQVQILKNVEANFIKWADKNSDRFVKIDITEHNSEQIFKIISDEINFK